MKWVARPWNEAHCEEKCIHKERGLKNRLQAQHEAVRSDPKIAHPERFKVSFLYLRLDSSFLVALRLVLVALWLFFVALWLFCAALKLF